MWLINYPNCPQYQSCLKISFFFLAFRSFVSCLSLFKQMSKCTNNKLIFITNNAWKRIYREAIGQRVIFVRFVTCFIERFSKNTKCICRSLVSKKAIARHFFETLEQKLSWIYTPPLYLNTLRTVQRNSILPFVNTQVTMSTFNENVKLIFENDDNVFLSCRCRCIRHHLSLRCVCRN